MFYRFRHLPPFARAGHICRKAGILGLKASMTNCMGLSVAFSTHSHTCHYSIKDKACNFQTKCAILQEASEAYESSQIEVL